jgi:hypothetical protein
MSSAMSDCPICKKSFVNVALHHTKVHAVFALNGESLMKDGVCISTLVQECDECDNLSLITEKSNDGNVYRLKLFYTGRTELWLTNKKNGVKHHNGTISGGDNVTLITTKIPLPHYVEKPDWLDDE